MSQAIDFFPRQNLCGNSGTSADFYSEIFDATEFGTLDVELRAYALSGAGSVTALYQECIDPCLNDGSWSSPYSALTVSSSGSASQATYSNPLGFVRYKVTVPAGIQATIAVRGVARRP
jgi:hypothetical protein